ncbi:MAG: Cadherin-like beta sandwich domain protein [Pelotomaculum sp. PtaU1.Bin065]|nr:MAG: Cadherin-like beta sandwich domain protein [Pelotomaculum sp. PtaU1.Bin065]
MGDNIARNKFANASSFVYPYAPAKAVDGTLTPLGRWLGTSPLPPEPTPPSPVWLIVDLGAFYWVNRWLVKQMGLIGWSPNYNLTDYKLQGSLDNANWFDLDSVTNNSANQTDRAIAPHKTRWVRVYVTKGLRCNTNFASIVDLEIYAADPTNPYLSNLVLSNSLVLNPPFSQTTNTYTSNAGYDLSSITITPTVADSNATIKVNGIACANGQPSAPVNLNAGVNNPIPVEVYPAIGEVNTYTVNVTRASSPYLSAMLIVGIKGGGLTPTFNKTTYAYTSSVANTKTTAQIQATAEAGGSITVNGVAVQSGQPSQVIDLQVGTNLVTVICNAAIGSDFKKYEITITRAAT